MTNQLQLAELLAARFCHDIAGPIGAVNNGVEFMSEEDEDMKEKAIELVENSAKEGVARLRFFRQAYGKANANGEANLEELHALMQGIFAHTKATLEWDAHHRDAANVPLTQRQGKLLLNLVVIAMNSLLVGGTVTITLDKSQGERGGVTIRSQGEKVKLDEVAQDILLGKLDTEPLSTKTIQYFLTFLIADESSTILALDVSETELVINVTL